MPNDENIIFSGFESGFVESFIIGEEKRYVKEILKKLPVLNNDIINTLNDLDNIDELIIFANYSFNYKLHNKTDFKYEYSKEYKSVDENNNLYILHKDILIPVYQIRGIDNNLFFLLHLNYNHLFFRSLFFVNVFHLLNIQILVYQNN